MTLGTLLTKQFYARFSLSLLGLACVPVFLLTHTPAVCHAEKPKDSTMAHSTPSIATATPQGITANKPQPSTKLKPNAPWKKLEPGLEHATFPLQSMVKGCIEVLRFDPALFTFVLHNISQSNTYPQTLNQWASDTDTVAAINASMYLPDGRTSTGYMRSGKHENNKRIAKSFGAFFLAQPKKEDLASATLLEKDKNTTLNTLENYDVVIQNFRLISADRTILWSPGGQKHSIAAVGEDAHGNILFLHCRQPIEAHAFAKELLRLPLDIRTVMYVEGGAQAGMILRQNNENTFWGGHHPADALLGPVAVALPNILGVKRKKKLN